MSEETTSHLSGAEAVQVEKGGTALIWLLPFIAAMIAGWLLYKSVSEAGVIIQIEFESAEGIEEKKTHIRYKGLNIGEVKKITINPDLKSVVVEAEMIPEVEAHLRDGTRFWLVSPKVSLTEVTGLDTLVSGNYIAVTPGQGEKRYRFKALPKSPPIDESSPGLHLKLSADKLGSIDIGSGVYYREIQVGRVVDVELEENEANVSIAILIEEQYSNLVKARSRFWNTSGISLKADLSGIEIQTGSFLSMISGGVAFYNPPFIKGVDEPSKMGDQFTLYKDYNSAEDGIMVKLRLPSGESVTAGKTTVRLGGLEVGIVKEVIFDGSRQAIANVKFHPHARTLLKEKAQFWLVDPEFSLMQMPDVNTLIQGKYIAIKEGDGEPLFEFELLKKRPDSDRTKLGLYVTLLADELGSLEKGSPILFRKIKVGKVEDFQLDKVGERVEVQIYINEDYAHLVTQQSRFWNASGVSIRAGIEGVNVNVESVSSLFSGGVTFFNPETTQKPVKASRDDRFKLYKDEESAEHDSFPIKITFSAANGLQRGAAIKFQGLKIGRVDDIVLTGQNGEVVVMVLIYQKAQSLVRNGTAFWIVKPHLGLARTDNLGTLVEGLYIAIKPGEGRKESIFKGLNRPPLESYSEGLQLTLVAPNRGSVKQGDPLYYRQIQVGQVIGSALAPKNNAVFIYLNIEKKYAPLVRDNSEFWPVSGLRIGGGLFEGIDIETESVEALLSGGLAFATPGDKQLSNRVSNNHLFELNPKKKALWANWSPEILLDQ